MGSARTFKTLVVLSEGAIVGKFRIVDFRLIPEILIASIPPPSSGMDIRLLCADPSVADNTTATIVEDHVVCNTPGPLLPAWR